MYNSIAELMELAARGETAMWRVVLDNEVKLTGKTEDEIFQKLDGVYEVMLASAKGALARGLPTIGGLIEGAACAQYAYASGDGGIAGGFINTLVAYALSCSEVNASMGRICAAPTAGACGILPAVLISLEEKNGYTRRQVLEALLLASGLGAVVVQNATVSGAEGGCQVECGVAAAMSAAAAVQLRGGSCAAAVSAFSIALMNIMGLVCDPIAGLVQVPCAQRNASQAVNAIISADMALAGMECVIPADEMIEAMFKVGRMLPPQLKETAEGGIAATAAGKAIRERIFAGK